MSDPPLSTLLDRVASWGAVPHSDLEAGDVPDELWERLETTAVSRGVRVVPKRRYCQRCEHFAEPPRMACTREGTEIEALVDTDCFRVRNCPVDRER